jgi:hypothetical protein
MIKCLILFALTIVISLPAITAYCGGSGSMTLVVSATLPEHVMDNDISGAAPLSNNLVQLVQTQTVIRNNQSIRLVSIVVP